MYDAAKLGERLTALKVLLEDSLDRVNAAQASDALDDKIGLARNVEMLADAASIVASGVAEFGEEPCGGNVSPFVPSDN